MSKPLVAFLLIGLLASFVCADDWLVGTLYDVDKCTAFGSVSYDLSICLMFSDGHSTKASCSTKDNVITVTTTVYSDDKCKDSSDQRTVETTPVGTCDDGITYSCQSSASSLGETLGDFYLNKGCDGAPIGVFRSLDAQFICANTSAYQGCHSSDIIYAGLNVSIDYCPNSSASGLVAPVFAAVAILLAFAF